jgi:hypothetical protein
VDGHAVRTQVFTGTVGGVELDAEVEQITGELGDPVSVRH